MPRPQPDVVPPVTHADLPVRVVVRVVLPTGAEDAWEGEARAWTSAAVYVAVRGYRGWWPAEDVTRIEDEDRAEDRSADI
jgi:hypothetical protein